MTNKNNQKHKLISSGFTIVELLIVIVVIGILAAISVVSYTGISQQAAKSGLKSDLKGAYTKLELGKVVSGYPATKELADNGNGIPASPGTTLEYTLTGSEYCLTASSEGAKTSYHIDSSTGGVIEDGACAGHVGYVSGGGGGGGTQPPMGGNDFAMGANYIMKDSGTSNPIFIVQSTVGNPNPMLPYQRDYLAGLPKDSAVVHDSISSWYDTIVSSQIQLSDNTVIVGRDATGGETASGPSSCGWSTCPFPASNSVEAQWSDSGTGALKQFTIGNRAYDLSGTGVTEAQFNDEITNHTATITIATSEGYNISYSIGMQAWPN